MPLQGWRRYANPGRKKSNSPSPERGCGQFNMLRRSLAWPWGWILNSAVTQGWLKNANPGLED